MLTIGFEKFLWIFFSKEMADAHYWSIYQGKTNSNMDQTKQSDTATIKATSGADHTERTEKEQSNTERSDEESKLPASIHADEIELGKVAEHETIGRGEPNPLMNNKSAEDTKICTTEPNNINSVDTEKFKEEVSENMNYTGKDKGNTPESSATNHPVATHAKEEVLKYN